MKKIAVLALVLALLTLLCACGETEAVVTEIEKEVQVEVPTVPEEYLGYQELVEAMEAGDWDAALAFIEELERGPVPPIKEVEITPENFFDYFEFVEFPEQRRSEQKDRDGNVTLVDLYSGYYLKEGFTVAREKANECIVKVGLLYELHWYYNNKGIVTDLGNLSYKVTGKPGGVMQGDRLCFAEYVAWVPDTEPYYFISVGNTRLAGSRSDSTCLVPEENIQMVSASGTLYLYE